MKNVVLMLFMQSAISCLPNHILKTYQGKPFTRQAIPGKIQCEWYDKGGEGIAYHDSDSVNNGSGRLNPANGSFLNEFRMKEGVDISYTKTGGIDDNPFNKREPLAGQLYLGWTVPGEWVNYTVVVKESGSYLVAAMYTANADGSIALSIDGKEASGPLHIPSTHNNSDTVAWRQWHHWNRLDSLGSLQFSRGTHLLTLKITRNGNMNFDYLEFTKQR
jgi:hypothetical protein